MTETADVTCDVFLGGGLRIWQPRHGYRAATDPVFLAAATSARAGERVLDLGCGVGVALLALGHRVGGLSLTGVEWQPAYAALARRNAAENSIDAWIVQADLTDLPPPLRLGFDHVMANPPYFPPSAPAAREPGRAAALREETPLVDWIDVALRRLVPMGTLTMIHRAERLPEILRALEGRAGAIAVRPLAARTGRAAGRVIVQARKGARGRFRLLAPMVVHAAAVHGVDRDDFTDLAEAILRGGAALDWGDRL